MSAALLDVEQLAVSFTSRSGTRTVVADVSFKLEPGEAVAVVGESGSGKSVTALSITRLIDHTGGHIASGRIMFADRAGHTRDIATESADAMRALRGPEMAMIFQEPMSSLNPVLRIGDQITEGLMLHQGLGNAAAMAEARASLPERASAGSATTTA